MFYWLFQLTVIKRFIASTTLCRLIPNENRGDQKQIENYIYVDSLGLEMITIFFVHHSPFENIRTVTLRIQF